MEQETSGANPGPSLRGKRRLVNHRAPNARGGPVEALPGALLQNAMRKKRMKGQHPSQASPPEPEPEVPAPTPAPGRPSGPAEGLELDGARSADRSAAQASGVNGQGPSPETAGDEVCSARRSWDPSFPAMGSCPSFFRPRSAIIFYSRRCFMRPRRWNRSAETIRPRIA